MALIDIAEQKGDVDRSHGIVESLKVIKDQWQVDMSEMNVLDMFAGDGTWCTSKIKDEVAAMTCCDIDANKLAKIEGVKRVSGDIFDCLDHINFQKFNLIHIDNPSSVWKTNVDDGYTSEYFKLVNYIPRLFEDKCIVIHNLNTAPYGEYTEDSLWAQDRREFYGIEQSALLNVNDLIEFHKQYYADVHKLEVGKITVVPREMYQGVIYWWNIIYELKK